MSFLSSPCGESEALLQQGFCSLHVCVNVRVVLSHGKPETDENCIRNVLIDLCCIFKKKKTQNIFFYFTNFSGLSKSCVLFFCEVNVLL